MTPRELPPRSALLAVLIPVVIAAVLHALTFSAVGNHIHPNDSPGYLAPARALAEGRGFVNATGQPETLRTPGYPVLLALFFRLGSDIAGVVAFQHAVAVALVGLIAWVGYRLSRDVWVACSAGVALAIDVPTIQNANWVMSETLFTALVSLAAFATYRAVVGSDTRRSTLAAAGAGMFAGAATLTRPVGILLGLVIAAIIVMVTRPRRWRLALAALAAASIPPIAWAMRNAHETGHATLSSVAALNALEFRAAGVLAVQDSGDFESSRLARRAELIARACAELRVQYPRRSCEMLSAAERADVYSRIANEVIFAHPVSYLHLMARGIGGIFLGNGAAFIRPFTHMSQMGARFVGLLITLPLAALAIIGVFYWVRTGSAAWILIAFVAYFVVISAGAESDGRFRVPIMPLYAMLVGGGIGQLRTWLLRRRRPES